MKRTKGVLTRTTDNESLLLLFSLLTLSPLSLPDFLLEGIQKTPQIVGSFFVGVNDAIPLTLGFENKLTAG